MKEAGKHRLLNIELESAHHPHCKRNLSHSWKPLLYHLHNKLLEVRMSSLPLYWYIILHHHKTTLKVTTLSVIVPWGIHLKIWYTINVFLRAVLISAESAFTYNPCNIVPVEISNLFSCKTYAFQWNFVPTDQTKNYNPQYYYSAESTTMVAFHSMCNNILVDLSVRNNTSFNLLQHLCQNQTAVM